MFRPDPKRAGLGRRSPAKVRLKTHRRKSGCRFYNAVTSALVWLTLWMLFIPPLDSGGISTWVFSHSQLMGRSWSSIRRWVQTRTYSWLYSWPSTGADAVTRFTLSLLDCTSSCFICADVTEGPSPPTRALLSVASGRDAWTTSARPLRRLWHSPRPWQTAEHPFRLHVFPSVTTSSLLYFLP